jgi:hypothetical protein
MKKTFIFKAKVWIWPSNHASWYFVYVDNKVKDWINKHNIQAVRGMIPVKAKVGGIEWGTSLFSNKKEGGYIMPIKKEIRQKEGIFDKDTITIQIRPRA